MASYTFHPPQEAGQDASALERAELVRDGFVWGAFLFTAFWFFFHRLWLAGIGVGLAVLAVMAGLPRLGVNPVAASLASTLLAFLVGLEAPTLRRWTLARRGRPAVDVVQGSSYEEAEAKAISRYLAGLDGPRPGAAAAQPLTPYRAPASLSPALGIFPEPEGRR